MSLSRLWSSWRKRLFRAAVFGHRRASQSSSRRTPPPVAELLEGRVLPSIVFNYQEFHDPHRIPPGLHPSPRGILPQDNGFPFPVGYDPSDLRAAYGLDHVMFGNVAGDGTGQTIAIVDAFDNPAFLNTTDPHYAESDLAQFDAQLGIPDPPSFLKLNTPATATMRRRNRTNARCLSAQSVRLKSFIGRPAACGSPRRSPRRAARRASRATSCAPRR